MHKPRPNLSPTTIYTLTWLALASSFFFILFASPDPYWYDDGLRHITIAKQFWFRGIHTWHEYFFAGYFSTRELNPWFLSDLAYMPLAWLDPTTGLKLTTLWQIALLAFSFYLLLRQLHINPLLRVLFIGFLLLGSELFTVRILLGRPLVISTAVFLLILLAILQRRNIIVALLVAVSVLLSHMFVFTLVLSGVSFFWTIWCENGRLRGAIRIAYAWLGGVLLGILLHPQNKQYLNYIAEVFLSIPFSKNLGIGGEFTSGLLDADPAIFFAWGLLPVLFVFISRQLGKRYLFHHRASFVLLFSLSVVFFGGYLFWQRTIDYLWPLLLLTLASMLSCSTQIQNSVHQGLLRRRLFGLSFLHLILLLGLWQVTSLWVGARQTSTRQSLSDFDVLQGLPPQSRVFNLDWDYFPAYFFFRPDLLYARGMDPTLDYKHSAEDFSVADSCRSIKKWQSLREFLAQVDWEKGTIEWTKETSALNAKNWTSEILQRFQPEYLVLDKTRYPKLVSKLNRLSILRLIHQSPKIAVYQVLNPNTNNKIKQ